MVEVFNLHKFLFSLNHEGKIKEHEILFEDRNGEEKKIILDKIEISSSHVSCRLFDKEGNRYIVPFIRIKKVFFQGELVFDNSDVDKTNVKIIKGYN